MATHIEVLAFLRPNGGYVARGDEYEGIEFLECEPFTKSEYQAAFVEYDVWAAEEATKSEAKKKAAVAKLEALGLDLDDLKALGLG